MFSTTRQRPAGATSAVSSAPAATSAWHHEQIRQRNSTAWEGSFVIGRSRAERKAATILRAQLALKHAVERIDFDFDVIKPKLEEIRALETSNVVEIEAGEEDLDASLGHA